jgi:SecD/SecF fusion protein
MPRATFSQIVNRSMSEVMTRSLATSFCTLLPVSALLVFGGETLKDFAFALLVGIASGTYSSIFIASPVLTAWKEREAVYVQRRRRAIEAFGMVPAFAVAGTSGAPAAEVGGIRVGRGPGQPQPRLDGESRSVDGRELDGEVADEPELEVADEPELEVADEPAVEDEPAEEPAPVEGGVRQAREPSIGDGAEPARSEEAKRDRIERRKRTRQRRRKHGRRR